MPSQDDSATDRECIRELLSSYGRLWDAGNIDGVVALFAAHGEWRSKHGAAEGATAITSLLHQIAAGRGSDRLVRRHFTSNVSITIERDAATVESDFLVVQQDGGAFRIVSMGLYSDSLIKQPSGWRFACRTIVHPA